MTDHRPDGPLDECAAQQAALRRPDCAQAVRREPTLGFWHTFRAGDGQAGIGQAEIPLAAFLPWTKHLTTEQQWQMLGEAAESGDAAACFNRWWVATLPAEQADVERAEAAYWEAFRRSGEARGADA